MTSSPAPVPPPTATAPATLTVVRAVLLGIFLFGVIGTEVDLLLLGHTDGAWQWLPIVMLGASLLVLAWYGAARSAAALRVFQGMMLLFIVSGVVGTLLHYRGNVEFELELHPSLGGLALFWDAVRGATPALAPGTMIQLGLIGLAYTFRHSALARVAGRASPSEDS